MTVASEIRAIGDADFALRGAASTLGSDVTLPKGTKWAVTYITAVDAINRAAGVQARCELFNVTGAVVEMAVGYSGVGGTPINVSNAGAPLHIIDASAAAQTLRVRNNLAGTCTGLFVLEQLY